jgi:hypothetical protein
MSGLRDAINTQAGALGELQRSRDGSVAWADEQRYGLDRQCLEPLDKDGRRLLEALRKAAHEFTTAEGMLVR